jgi:hypothetical protein
MAKKHNVKVCKGTFRIIGNVVGVSSDRFFKSMTFDSGASKNQCTFGLESSPKNVNYVTVDGFDGKEAWFSKWDNVLKSNDIKKVAWDDRFNFSEDGYNPFFGTRIGVELDENNKPIISTLFGYDAAQELSATLEDGMGIYTEGQIVYTSYAKGDELKRYKNFVPQKVYAQNKPIDFESEKFKEENRFEQELIFMAIEQEKDPETNKATGRFILSSKIVTRDGVEDAEFIIEDKSLADKIRKGLKPYNSISVLGRLVTKVEEADTSDDDAWGDDEDMGGGNTIKFREMIITKAYPTSIDKESYSEEILASITQAKDDFGDTESDTEDGDDDVWE